MTKREQILTKVAIALSELVLDNDRRIEELKNMVTELENKIKEYV